MQGYSTGLGWIFLLVGLVTVILTGTVVGVILLAQRRAIAQSRRFSLGLVDAQEAERARIARDLHDDIIQRIALLGGEVTGLERAVPNPTEAFTQRIEGLREELHDLAENVRQVARRTHPAILDHVGLVKSIANLVSDLEGSDHLHVDLHAEGSAAIEGLAPAEKLSLYRMAQEGLRNVIRHSETLSATLQITVRGGGASLTIIDQGRGMDLTLPRQGGIGLHGLTERLRAVGGRLDVDSSPGHGLRLSAWVPMKGVSP